MRHRKYNYCVQYCTVNDNTRNSLPLVLAFIFPTKYITSVHLSLTCYWEWLKFEYLCLWTSPHRPPNFPTKMRSWSTPPFFKKQKYCGSVCRISSKHRTTLDFRYAETRWKVTLAYVPCSYWKLYASLLIFTFPEKKDNVAVRAQILRLKTQICYFWKKVAFIFLHELFLKFAWQDKLSCFRKQMRHLFQTSWYSSALKDFQTKNWPADFLKS